MAESFNTMQAEIARAAIALDGARNELQAHRDRLESRVAERTSELELLNAALHEADDERRRLLERTVQVAENERTRLALDLHDGPVQRLAAVGLNIDRCVMRLDRESPDTARDLLATVHTDLQHEIAALRTLMSELRPPVLDEGGLGPALRDYAQLFETRTGIQCTANIELASRLEPGTETVLYRVMQEALTNVEKHADASHVTISLTTDSSGAHLTVGDNGGGFDTASASADAQRLRNGHFGLAGCANG